MTLLKSGRLYSFTKFCHQQPRSPLLNEESLLSLTTSFFSCSNILYNCWITSFRSHITNWKYHFNNENLFFIVSKFRFLQCLSLLLRSKSSEGWAEITNTALMRILMLWPRERPFKNARRRTRNRWLPSVFSAETTISHLMFIWDIYSKMLMGRLFVQS